MSKIGSYVMDLQDIVDPMVYEGFSEEAIIKEVEDRIPGTPSSWVKDMIATAQRELGWNY